MLTKRLSTGVRDISAGDGCTIVEPSNLYECTLGRGVFIGPFVEVQKGVSIGDNTRVQSHSFVCELVTIGRSCFIGHGVMFINDLFAKGAPAMGDRTLWRSTTIGDDVSIGSNATILPVSIVAGTVIGAGSVVTKDITVKGVYAGNPARLVKKIP